jgi:asparagine N-glycosylation enzyme membrane subunit Stt3
VTSLSSALRRGSSIILAVAFVAMATSGLFMLVVDRFGSQLRMHPVHNVFGIVMVAAGILHAVLNRKTLVGHLRLRGPMALGVLLAVVMVLLFVEGFSRPVDREAVRKVEEIVSAARQAERGD